MGIPTIIHYCWFGRNPLPELAQKCIKSWKRYLKDYEIIQWNEDNFDISACPLYVRQAYAAKKWAFVSDYVRLKVVYDHGGIYLDTDVQVLKSWNPLLDTGSFFGFENAYHVNTGVGFGAEKGSMVLHDMLMDYADIPFLMPDGSYDTTPCPERNTATLLQYGLQPNGEMQRLAENIMIYPKEYFCPLDYESGSGKKTANTYSIHHFSASWHNEEQRKRHLIQKKKIRQENLRLFPKRLARRIFGNERIEKLKAFLYRRKD